LPHLPVAGRAYDATVAVEFEAALIPRQADEIQHGASPAYLVIDQRFIRNVQDRARRQHRVPVRHGMLIFFVALHQILQVVGVGMRELEALKIDRKTGVDRIALHVNDARVGENRMDQSKEQEIAGHLVDDSICRRRKAVQLP